MTAGDITGVTGLNIYKFRIPMKPDTKFDIAISVQDAPGERPRYVSRHSLTSHADANAVDLLLSFLPHDERIRGVLLSQDEEINYRVECPECSPSGFGTVISLPLNELRGTHKTLVPMTSRLSSKLSSEDEICLIAILASDPGQSLSTKEIFPRAKVSVQFTESKSD